MTEKGMNSKYFLTKLEILLLHCLILPFKLVQYIRNAIDNHEQKTHRNRCIGNADRYSECRGQLIMHVVQNAETLVGDDQIKEKKYINDRGGNFVLNAFWQIFNKQSDSQMPLAFIEHAGTEQSKPHQ